MSEFNVEQLKLDVQESKIALLKHDEINQKYMAKVDDHNVGKLSYIELPEENSAVTKISSAPKLQRNSK